MIAVTTTAIYGRYMCNVMALLYLLYQLFPVRVIGPYTSPALYRYHLR